eukprot:COSAG01_NODE_38822_length_484_cov_9.688312_2_plen_65_part_01
MSALDADLGQKFGSVSELRKICENGADTEVEFVDSDVFDRLMLLSSSGVSRDDASMWTEYCSTCK